MRRLREEKKKMFIIGLILLTLGIGLGYAVLSQQLTIDNTISYDSMKWEVGFSSVADNGGTITSTSSIGSDGKSITVNCDFGLSTSQESCIVKATITNNSTFDIGLTDDPIITYDDTYIHTLTFKWNNHPTYENRTVLKDNFIAKGETEEVILTIKTKNLNEDMLPSQDISIPITITLNFTEWQGGTLPTTEELAILKSDAELSGIAFRSEKYINYIGSGNSSSISLIKNITFEDEINVPSDAVESWDISSSENGSIIASVVPNDLETEYYDLYIQSDKQIYANDDMSYWFSRFDYLDSINGLDLVNTSQTTNMSSMFYDTGHYSTTFTLDVSNFDTSNVTNMSDLFSDTGLDSTNFTLDVSNFDTGKVTDMSEMFTDTGCHSTLLTLDVSNFDTSKVTNMSNMFYGTGLDSTNFTLDVSNFDTSKVTDMSHMFTYTGYSNPNFTLDISNFDTSNVTNMNNMFAYVGYKSTNLTLDVSNIDTSNVTDMRSMFTYTGYKSTNLTLDVGGFDTSNVTNMGNMFYKTGYNSTIFTLDVSNFDTSKVTDMSNMFYETGYNSTKLNTSITIRNPNVTSSYYSYSDMFYNVATQQGSQITVNYTSATSSLVDKVIATKSSNSNVVKGVQVD